MNWSKRSRVRWLPFIGVVIFLGACGVPQALSPALSDSAGSAFVNQMLSQPFLAPADGLNGVSIAISPPLESGGDLQPQPTGGATLAIRYAPAADQRFPETAFHDWPASDAWLGELTGDQSYGQSFLSRYPNLNGITVRVATFGADTGVGPGTLKAGPARNVLDFPVDGDSVGTVSGGSVVQVVGAAEGWAQITFGAKQSGYLSLSDFAELPSPTRHNTQDVTLSLYREGDAQPLRSATLNASQMHDNSHLSFIFGPIADSDGQRYRFVLTSPRSTPGNAVTFRIEPTTTYREGTRYVGGRSAAGAMVFRPDFGPGAPIYETNVDKLGWSSLDNAFTGTFSARQGTANRFLRLELTPGTRPLTVHWSLIRPDGGLPMVVDGNSATPGGGLVFNVRFQGSLAVAAVLRASGHNVWHDMKDDPLFFALYLSALLLLLGWCGWASLRWMFHGRRSV